MTKKGYRNFQR